MCLASAMHSGSPGIGHASPVAPGGSPPHCTHEGGRSSSLPSPQGAERTCTTTPHQCGAVQGSGGTRGSSHPIAERASTFYVLGAPWAPQTRRSQDQSTTGQESLVPLLAGPLASGEAGEAQLGALAGPTGASSPCAGPLPALNQTPAAKGPPRSLTQHPVPSIALGFRSEPVWGV